MVSDFLSFFMHTAIVTIPLPPDLTLEQYAAYTSEIAARFQGVPGLVRKNFLFNREVGLGGGVYTWVNRAVGERFYAGVWRENILAKFGVEPKIEWFDSPVIVDNESGKVTR
jgi:hypothetical protein